MIEFIESFQRREAKRLSNREDARCLKVKESCSALNDNPVLTGAEVTLSAAVDFQYLTSGSELKYSQRTKMLVPTSFRLFWTNCVMYLLLHKAMIKNVEIIPGIHFSRARVPIRFLALFTFPVIN